MEQFSECYGDRKHTQNGIKLAYFRAFPVDLNDTKESDFGGAAVVLCSQEAYHSGALTSITRTVTLRSTA